MQGTRENGPEFDESRGEWNRQLSLGLLVVAGACVAVSLVGDMVKSCG